MHQCKTSNSLCVHHWLLVCFQSPRYKGNLIEIDKYFSCSHTDKIIFIFFISLATWPGVTTEVAGGQWPWFTAECYRAAAGWRGLPGSPGQAACSQRGEYKILSYYVSTVFFWCVVECVFYELYGDRPRVDKEIRFLQTAITFIEIFWRMSNNILFSVETGYLNVFSCFQKCGNEGKIYWQDDDECNLHSTFDLKMQKSYHL